MIYIGIDPGLDGALCALNRDTGDIRFWDTPTKQVKGSTKTFTVLDAPKIVAIVRYVLRSGDVQAVIERVNAGAIGMKIRGRAPCPACNRMPQPGAASTFNFGLGYGIWIGVLTACDIQYNSVTPAVWKRQVMGAKDKDTPRVKSDDIDCAKALYPQAAPSLTRKKDHGRADALLLAHYGSNNSIAQAGEMEAPPLFEAAF